MTAVSSVGQLREHFACRSQVQRIDLKNRPSVNDALLRRLADYIPLLPHLETLNLAGCKKITDRGVSELFSWPNFSLKHLDLSGCGQVTGQIDSDPLYLTHLRCLTELVLDSCAITDDTLKALSKHRSLQALNISHCAAISDQGLEALLSKKRGCPLKALSARECPHLTFKNLYKLRALALSGRFVTDTTLIALAKATYLDALYLTGCAISDEGLERLFSSPLSLTIFKIRNCPAVTGRWMQNLSVTSLKNLNQLKEFGFSECPHELPSSLFEFLPSLERLDLSNCPQLTDQAAYDICVHHPYLQVYRLDGCPQVAGTTLDTIQNFLNLRMR